MINELVQNLVDQAKEITTTANGIKSLAIGLSAANVDNFGNMLTILVLAMFVGYYVVWKVTPALHAPLMAVTNAISSVIIVGGILALGQSSSIFAKLMGFFAVFLSSINIAGGFFITQRMLNMFTSKKGR